MGNSLSRVLYILRYANDIYRNISLIEKVRAKNVSPKKKTKTQWLFSRYVCHLFDCDPLIKVQQKNSLQRKFYCFRITLEHVMWMILFRQLIITSNLLNINFMHYRNIGSQKKSISIRDFPIATPFPFSFEFLYLHIPQIFAYFTFYINICIIYFLRGKNFLLQFSISMSKDVIRECSRLKKKKGINFLDILIEKRMKKVTQFLQARFFYSITIDVINILSAIEFSSISRRLHSFDCVKFDYLLAK